MCFSVREVSWQDSKKFMYCHRTDTWCDSFVNAETFSNFSIHHIVIARGDLFCLLDEVIIKITKLTYYLLKEAATHAASFIADLTLKQQSLASSTKTLQNQENGLLYINTEGKTNTVRCSLVVFRHSSVHLFFEKRDDHREIIIIKEREKEWQGKLLSLIYIQRQIEK